MWRAAVLAIALVSCKTESALVVEAGVVTRTDHSGSWVETYTYDCGTDKSYALCIGTTFHPEEWNTEALASSGYRFNSGDMRDFEQYRKGDSVNITITDTYWIRENKPRKLLNRSLVMFKPRKAGDPREGR